MKNIRILDMDGTLTDSMMYIARSVLRVLDEEGIPYTYEMMAKLTPIGFYKTAEYFSELGVPGSVEEILARITGNLLALYETEVPMKEGAREFILRSKAEGARLFILTASLSAFAHAALRRHGLADCIEGVFSTEDLHLAKDNPALFHRVLDMIGCTPADVIYYDDNPVAVKTAKACGLETYGVYDKQSDEVVAAMRADTDHFIMSFSELL